MTKTKRLSIKLLPSDKSALERLAHAEGESYAVIVRRLIRRAAAEIVQPAPTSTPDAETGHATA